MPRTLVGLKPTAFLSRGKSSTAVIPPVQVILTLATFSFCANDFFEQRPRTKGRSTQFKNAFSGSNATDRRKRKREAVDRRGQKTELELVSRNPSLIENRSMGWSHESNSEVEERLIDILGERERERQRERGKRRRAHALWWRHHRAVFNLLDRTKSSFSLRLKCLLRFCNFFGFYWRESNFKKFHPKQKMKILLSSW